MCEIETDESRTQVVPTVAGSDLMTLQGLLLQALPVLRNPEMFAEPERMALATTICETLQTAPEEDHAPGGLLALWE